MSTESNIYKLLQNTSDISNLHEIETKNIEDSTYFDYSFNFSGMKFLGSQISNPLFTLNKMTVLFRYDLKKETTRAAILETLNTYNAERPLMNATLANYQGKKVTIAFSSDFICDDKAINERQIVPLINIMAPSPIDFVNYLEKKKIAIVRK
ncbi:hypothetical protein ACJA3S_08780 [Pseudomonas sp. KnCO4]|uniref:hypothetical protein n=1 Tax=Pseudomonas sp. KnCO4 TaxID=3381355 RepID=UPI003877E577